MIYKDATGPKTKKCVKSSIVNKILFWCSIRLLMNMAGPETFEKAKIKLGTCLYGKGQCLGVLGYPENVAGAPLVAKKSF